ncbi:MAG: Asp-tRNA(Asn)/Glu-tRNA(Gln) amidotransferase subunit GatC [Candidatus Nealsonbacteria bacterium]|nr:Asp-tRNA(Asn)/Glu-tRNA(Gln) amidotransferase subunit GatC [Candidatus Nealsonbacteria bacterium]
MIKKDEVEKIAKLARLELDEKEIESMQKDMTEILDYFNLLKKVKGNADDSEFFTNENLPREDKVISQTEELPYNLIKASPDKKDRYIKVKVILE